MTTSFTNQVILITGAASGIGRATSLALSRLGATLALSDINPTGLAETNSLCGGSHFTEVLDVSSSSACASHISNIISTYATINHVFNCAGVNPTPSPLVDTTDTYWDKLMNTNLKGLYNITRAAVPYMPPKSSFVNVSSLLGLHPGANNAIYCATKYGVIGFSKAMALELGPVGLRVNVIAPGYIDTPTNAAVVAGVASVRDAERGIAAGRMGTPEEVAEVVVFLMGEGSRYVNGSVVEVNGGTG
jgi:NAD(P)-dependent dehydrogenase (short-subunit alcohol dehydrogenase family)